MASSTFPAMIYDQQDQNNGDTLLCAGSHLSDVQKAINGAVTWAWEAQADDHWRGEVRTNANITAQQVFFYQSLGRNPIPDAEAYRKYLLEEQQDDGSWALAWQTPGDVSTSCEVYLALKILGVSPNSVEMTKARRWILEAGGVAAVRVFTRIFFAQFGLFPWNSIPQLPAELILLPPHAWINIYRMSYWARTTIVPLLIIAHHQHLCALPNGRSAQNDFLDELWLDPARKEVPCCPSLWKATQLGFYTFFFSLIDMILYFLNGLRNFPLRSLARKRCVEWILEHQEPTGDWGGISPPMHACVQALLLEGFTEKDREVRVAIEAIENFTWEDTSGKRMQSCVSPVWDTVLMTRALCDSGVANIDDNRLQRAAGWIRRQQIRNCKGDWFHYRNDLQPGGFAFQYHNNWYPDLDDTSAAVISLLRQDPGSVTSDTVIRAVEWMCGMQNHDNGWGAFEADNDHLWLNKIPFSDLDALCDPSTSDITAHVLEAFGIFTKELMSRSSQDYRYWGALEKVTAASNRAIQFLAVQQETFGAWWGRWGVNYVYGTSAVLSGLAYFCENDEMVQEMMSSGVRWLKHVQNPDGGWGEGVESYQDQRQAGRGVSTPAQTAWGIMGLLEVCKAEDDSIVMGINYLLRTQTVVSENGTRASWDVSRYTGTGFPNHLYLEYALYKHYFPLMALGRYAKALRGEISDKL
ncbi:unnamed protein product [Clonostachys rosea]|uniref:Terpene cyclase/mutase family member n=1 Tax=Bionectria ochroleuca TaxID=29856 RepID=A0ABY6UHH9_BIOOC|nr:unnamed protein product [Clonostachys rosea]